jgi:universal stress protein E
MERLRHILVGLAFDDSSGRLTVGSRAAASRGLWLAGRTGARVEFLHSTHRHPEHGEGGPPAAGGPDLTELEALVAEHGGAPPALVTSEEPAWVALSRRVSAGSDDLVVVGKRNRPERHSRRLGSIALRLIHVCPSPVWIAKPEQLGRHGTVMAATDLSAVGDRATEYAAYVARIEECDLHVVHAWQMPMELQLSATRIGDAELERRLQQLESEAREHILALPGVAALGDRVHAVVRRGTPSRTILDHVARVHPDVVALGTISRSGFAGFLVGNTAERLLHRLDCSLLTVKPEDFVCPLE